MPISEQHSDEEKTVILPATPRPYRIGFTTGATTVYREIWALSLQDAIATAEGIASFENAQKGWF